MGDCLITSGDKDAEETLEDRRRKDGACILTRTRPGKLAGNAHKWLINELPSSLGLQHCMSAGIIIFNHGNDMSACSLYLMCPSAREITPFYGTVYRGQLRSRVTKVRQTNPPACPSFTTGSPRSRRRKSFTKPIPLLNILLFVLYPHMSSLDGRQYSVTNHPSFFWGARAHSFHRAVCFFPPTTNGLNNPFTRTSSLAVWV